MQYTFRLLNRIHASQLCPMSHNVHIRFGYSSQTRWENQSMRGSFTEYYRVMVNLISIFTVRKRSLRRLCFYTCLSFCSQGGSLPQCILGYHPPEQTPPRPGTLPPGPGTPRTSPPLPGAETATAADGTHPTGMHSCVEDEFCICALAANIVQWFTVECCRNTQKLAMLAYLYCFNFENLMDIVVIS